MRIDRRGQAFVETAIGLFVMVFILTALFTFGLIFPEAQRHRSLVRWMAGYNAQHSNAPFDTAMNGAAWDAMTGFAGAQGIAMPGIPAATSPNAESLSYEVDIRNDIGSFAADEVFGLDSFRIKTEAYLPGMSVPCAGGGVE